MTTNTAGSAPRPKRLLTPSHKLLDASNSAVPTLSAHKRAIEAKRAGDAVVKCQQQHSIPKAQKATLKDCSRDINHFFSPSYKNKNKKKYRNCRLCSKKSAQRPVPLVANVTTLRRHLQSMHKAVYKNWAGTNNFLSMLPKDTEKRRKDALAKDQQQLDPHLLEKPQKERVIPYTDELFRDAAIEWLVSTDQPLQAFEHPSFQKMIQIAARATNGVKIPDCRQTRQAIIDTLKQHFVSC